jgi:hypothetical protein
MKTIYQVLITLLLFYTIETYASDRSKPVGMMINSTEITQLSGIATITGYLKVFDTTYFESNPVYSANPGFTINSLALNSLTGNTRNLGDSIPFTIMVNYNPINLPFFPMKVEIQLNSKRFNQSELQPVKNAFYVYFTPYNTVEIWN